MLRTDRRGRYRVARTVTSRNPLIAVTLFILVGGLVAWRGWDLGAGASLYGVAVFTLLAGKLALSLLPDRAATAPVPGYSVGVVITVHNEDADLLQRCIESLQQQTHPVSRIVVVDDHSTLPDGGPDYRAYDVAAVASMLDPRIDVVLHSQQAGKREALVSGWRRMRDVDIYLCVDSDSTLEPHAVAEGVRRFSDPEVTAVTGLVIPENHDRGPLTRMQDVRYANSFITERAAYSALDSVLCVCGALAFYRADVAQRHEDAFLHQTFLDKPAVVGDDRHMTNLALSEGKVLFAPQSVSHTAVPERMSHYTRQQARWGRSFFRESIWALRNLSPRRAAWWLTLVELAQWAIFSTVLVYVAAVHPILTGDVIIADYLVFVGALALARSVRYFDVRRPTQTLRSRLASFASAPLYGYMALFVLLPLRFWSLATLRRTGWGTRSTVEVTAQPEPEAQPVMP